MRLSRRFVAVAITLVVGGLAIATAPAASAAPEARCNRNNNSTRKLLECVTLDGVLEHQQAFQEIADANGGTRAFGYAGLRRIG